MIVSGASSMSTLAYLYTCVQSFDRRAWVRQAARKVFPADEPAVQTFSHDKNCQSLFIRSITQRASYSPLHSSTFCVCDMPQCRLSASSKKKEPKHSEKNAFDAPNAANVLKHSRMSFGSACRPHALSPIGWSIGRKVVVREPIRKRH